MPEIVEIKKIGRWVPLCFGMLVWHCVYAMSNITNSTVGCVPENTAYNLTLAGGMCSCKQGYTGPRCENYNVAIVILALIIKIYETITAVVILSWLGLRCYDLKVTNKFKLTLSLISMLLITLANLIQLSYIWIPQDAVHITDQNISLIMIFGIVLAYSPTVVWLASTSLLVGFWYELLTKRLNQKGSAYITKILVIATSIGLIVFAVAGMLVVIADIDLILVAAALIFLPLIIAIIITSAVAFRIFRLNTSGLSDVIIEKQRSMSKIFAIVCTLWLICIVLIFVSLGISYTSAKPDGYIITNNFMFLEGTIPLLLMLANDWNCGSFRRNICGIEDDPRSLSRTIGSRTKKTSQSSSSSSPAPSKFSSDASTISTISAKND